MEAVARQPRSRARHNPDSAVIHVDHLMVGTKVGDHLTVRCPECGRAAIERPTGWRGMIEYHHSYALSGELLGPKHYAVAHRE
jgi:hypothetical protein